MTLPPLCGTTSMADLTFEQVFGTSCVVAKSNIYPALKRRKKEKNNLETEEFAKPTEFSCCYVYNPVSCLPQYTCADVSILF